MGKSLGFRSRFSITLACLTLLANPAFAAVGDLVPGRDFPMKDPALWLACSSLIQKDNCIEKIEYFDESSQSWITGTEIRNPWFKPNVTLPMREGDPSGKLVCGTGNTSPMDVCYQFPNAAIDGTDQYIGTTIYSTEEVSGYPRIKISFQALNGVDPRQPKSGLVSRYQTLKPGTSWKVTLLADSIAQHAGLAWAWMKNPNIDIAIGTDGKHRLVTSGTVQEVHSYWIPRGAANPCDVESKNELTANDYQVEYSINIDPYVREYAVLDGTSPGGIFISQNGGCGYGVTIDEKDRVIKVISKGTHFDVFGNVITGWVEASIRGDVIRKVFKMEPKYMQEALIEITDSDGVPQAATFTTKYVSATDKVEIRGYGYHYSQTNIRIKLQSTEKTPTPSPSLPVEEKSIKIDQTKVKLMEVSLGQHILLTGSNPEKWKIKILDPKILKFLNGKIQGSRVTYPSLSPLRVGWTNITLSNGKKNYTIKVVIKPH